MGLWESVVVMWCGLPSFPSSRKTGTAKLYSWDDSQLQAGHALLTQHRLAAMGTSVCSFGHYYFQEKQTESFGTSWLEPTSDTWRTCLTQHYGKGKAWELGGVWPEHSLCRLSPVRWEVQLSLDCSM